MNWELIDEKYPKAYAKAEEWFDDNIVYNSIRLTECTLRWLYDFFDGEGMFIHLEAPYSIEGGLDGFSFDIHGDSGGFSEQKYYSTRTEAEEQAFIRAFEILEDRLK